LDWTVPIDVAAAEKLPVSAMPKSACKCFSSIGPPLLKTLAGAPPSITITDVKYLLKLLD
jgi:hypothetical protein